MKSFGANASITTSGINAFFSDSVTWFYYFTFLEIRAETIDLNITNFTKTMIAFNRIVK